MTTTLIKAFFFTESTQEHYLTKGKYLIQCFGAQGGRGLAEGVLSSNGGKGAFTSGIIDIKMDQTLFFFVGGKGEDGRKGNNILIKGGWNGGGNGGPETGFIGGNDTPGGGGGATDVRTGNSYTTRLMVAAGGSGGCFTYDGAPGGELNGLRQSLKGDKTFINSGVNQKSGVETGKGESGENNLEVPSSGGGGGYRGGTAYNSYKKEESYKGVASSGSSYISGFDGKPSSRWQLYFTNCQMKSGVNSGDGLILLYSVNEVEVEKEVEVIKEIEVEKEVEEIKVVEVEKEVEVIKEIEEIKKIILSCRPIKRYKSLPYTLIIALAYQ